MNSRLRTVLPRIVPFLKKYQWYVLGILALIVALVFFLSDSDNGAEETPSNRVVQMISVAEYGSGAPGVAVPTANGNSYVIRSEASGKVLRAASTGAVAAGALIAQLENSAQRAALIQAEGVYEAALASSGGNATTQQSARQDGVRVWTSATVAAAETLRTSIDTFYADVRGTQGVQGFKLDAFGTAQEFNSARNAIETGILDRWETEQVSDINAAERLAQLDTDLATIGSLVDRIAALIPRQAITSAYSESDRSADSTALAAARAAITTQQEQVDAARTAITNASGSGDASAQAQVKQALGTLEAARANFEKTVIRSPFAGTITSVNVSAGDIVSIGGDIAIVVPENGAVTERSFSLPLSSVKYTPAGALVFVVSADGTLESRSVETGLVTADSIAVTGLNGDENIVMDVRGLKAGQKVEIGSN